MAETVLRTLLQRAGLDGEIAVESFGTSGYHVGDGADPRAVAALARHGWPARAHRARQLTAAAIAASDLVLCADHENLDDARRIARRGGVDDIAGPFPGGAVAGGGTGAKIKLLRSYDPLAGPGDDEVPDPWYGGDKEFDRALELIERSSAGLVDELSSVGEPRAGRR
jgi:protein-tyrosine phosphatase